MVKALRPQKGLRNASFYCCLPWFKMHFKHIPGFDKKYSLIILFSHQVGTKLTKTKLGQAALDRA